MMRTTVVAVIGLCALSTDAPAQHALPDDAHSPAERAVPISLPPEVNAELHPFPTPAGEPTARENIDRSGVCEDPLYAQRFGFAGIYSGGVGALNATGRLVADNFIPGAPTETLVAINEVDYFPSLPGFEYIELVGRAGVDLAGWKIIVLGLSGGVVVSGGEYDIAGTIPADFTSAWGGEGGFFVIGRLDPNSTAVFGGPDFTPPDWGSDVLPDSGMGLLMLIDAEGRVIDEWQYNSTGPTSITGQSQPTTAFDSPGVPTDPSTYSSIGRRGYSFGGPMLVFDFDLFDHENNVAHTGVGPAWNNANAPFSTTGPYTEATGREIWWSGTTAFGSGRGVTPGTFNHASYGLAGAQDAYTINIPGAGGITTLSWHGVFASNLSNLPTCTPGNPDEQWRVTYYADAGGVPGAVIAQFSTSDGSLVVTQAEITGSYAETRPRWSFTAAHGYVPVDVGVCYWFSIESTRSTASGSCMFFWENSLDGDRVALGLNAAPGISPANLLPRNMAWCLPEVPAVPSPGNSCATAANPLPPNDRPENAISVVIDGGPISGTTFGATYDPDAPDCDPNFSDLLRAADSPGVWYRLVGTGDWLSVDLCGSGSVDTQIAVYCGASGSLECIAGADSFCDVGFASVPGRDYYMFVNAGSTAYIDFVLNVVSFGPAAPADDLYCGPEPCPLDIPDSAVDEGEDLIEDANGGCNSSPPVFAPNVECAVVISGKAWAENGFRDTDWYSFTVTEESLVTWRVEAQFPALAFLFSQNGQPIDCNFSYSTVDVELGSSCSIVAVSAVLQPGQYVAWAGPSIFNGIPRDGLRNSYIATLTACRAPDLTVADLIVPVALPVGEFTPIQWTVRNDGTDETPSFIERVYLSNDDTIDASDELLLTRDALLPLAPGESTPRSASIRPPVGSGGPRYAIVHVSTSGAPETILDNNAASAAFEAVGPDLTPTSVGPSDGQLALAPTQNLTISYTIANQGTAASTGSIADRLEVLYYESLDATGTVVETLNLLPSPASTIAIGDEVVRSFSYPSGTFLSNHQVPGIYRFRITIDRLSSIGEINESNNTVLGDPVVVELADLAVSDLLVSPTPTLQQPTTISWTVTNLGTRPVPTGTTSRVDRTRGMQSDLIGSVPLSAGLAPGASIQQSIVWTPTSLPQPPDEFFRVTLDSTTRITETDETNNAAVTPLDLGAPDLSGPSLALESSILTLGQGSPFTLSYANTGTRTAAVRTGLSWTNRLYLSDDDALSSDDLLVATIQPAVNPLAVGGNAIEPGQITLPFSSSISPGLKHLIAQLDSADGVAEADEANNVSESVLVTVKWPDGPDLSPALVTGPPQAIGEQSIQVSWVTRNVGEVLAQGPWVDRVYLSVDAAFSAGDTLLGEFGFAGAVASGAETIRAVAVELPDLDGQHYLVVVSDAANDVNEQLDEGNNIAVSAEPITILPSPKPDLIVSEVKPLGIQPLRSTEVVSGTLVTVEFTVRNIGVGATSTPVWNDWIYLSTDPVIDAGDTVLARPDNPIYLQPDESYTRMVNATLPRDIVGTYYIGVITDQPKRVIESDETNNTGVSPSFPIALEPQPDLFPLGITKDGFGPAFSGIPLTVRWTTLNSDESPSAGGPTDVTNWQTQVWIGTDPTRAIVAGDRLLATLTRTGEGPLAPGAAQPRQATVTIPQDVSGPQFYIKVFEDSNNRVSEFGFEGNNIEVSGAIEVVASPPVNLVPSLISAPPSGLPGHELTVNYGGENAGAPALTTYTWSDRVYLSQGAFDPTTSIALAPSFSRSSGDPIEPYVQSRTTRVPNNTPPGTYFVDLRVDDTNTVPEGVGGEADNVLRAPMTIVIEDRAADLQVLHDGSSPLSAPAGGAVTIGFSIENIGDAPTPVASWTDRVLFSSDTSPGGDQTLRSVLRSGALAEGQSYVRGETVTLPFVPPGTYYLLLVADATDVVYEGAGEVGPNVTAVPVTITTDAADLVLTGIDAPPSADSGDTISVTWTVTNVGQRSTNVSAWRDRLDLLDDSGAIVATLPPSSRATGLASGASYSVTRSVQIPWSAEGPYTLRVRTDIDEVVFESSNANNTITAQVPVALTPPANLIAEPPTTPPDSEAGAAFAASFTVRNDGAGATNSDSWVDRLYLSPDPQFDPTDPEVAAVARQEALPAGESYSVEIQAIVPADLAGPVYTIVVIDRDDEVFESGPGSDNIAVSAAPFMVSAANLVAESISSSSPVNAGQPLQITWQVRNAGAATTPVAPWRDAIYLSRNQFIDGQDVLLGSVVREAPLEPGLSYTGSAELQIPAGLSGPFFLLLQADSTAVVPEAGLELDNRIAAQSLLEVVLPPPTDLVVVDVVPPATAAAGELASFDWTVGVDAMASSPASGQWEDSLFLSIDDAWDPSDPFIGRFTTDAGPLLLQGQTVHGTGVGRIPPVVPGMYHLVVRTDARDVIPETIEGNNTGGSSTPFEVTALPLELGVPFVGEFPAGTERYFQIDVPAGEFLRVTLDHASELVFSELYLKREAMPTPGNFDRIYENPGEPDQVLLLPQTADARYYILARVTGPTDGPTSATVLAEALPFAFLDAFPTNVGAGEVTIRVDGAQMPDDTQFALLGGTQRLTVPATRIVALGNSIFEATFDLSEAPGVYTLVATNGSDSDTFAQPVTVSPLPNAWLSARLENVQRLRVGQKLRGSLTVTNLGNVDVQVGQLVLALPAIGEGVATLTLYPDDPARRIDLVTESSPGSESYARLLLGRVRPQQIRAIPYALTFNEPSPVGLGVHMGALSQSRLEHFENEALDALLGTADALRDHLIVQGLDPVAAAAVRDRLIDDATLVWLTSFVRGEGITCGDALQARDVLWDALALGEASPASFYARWLPEVAACAYRATLCADEPCADADAAAAFVAALLSACDSGESLLDACPCALRSRDPFCELTLIDTARGQRAAGTITDECSGSDVFGSDGGNRPTAGPGPGQCVPPPVNSFDPNDLSGPIGTGNQQWISSRLVDRWVINFENVNTASAPANAVNITLSLPPSASTGSFRPAAQRVAMNENDLGGRQFFVQGRESTTSETGREVDYLYVAGVDTSDPVPEMFWSYTTIDPATGESPLDPFDGFLPRNDADRRGEGSIEFLLRPSPAARTGDVIELQASIVFDINEPIITNTWFNTIDADVPISAMIQPPPPALPGPLVPMTIAGEDPAGAGLAGVRVLVSTNGSAYRSFQEPTLEGLAVFEGEPGNVYRFVTQAVDKAGNVEALPPAPDAVTVLPLLTLDRASDTGPTGDGVTANTSPTLRVVSLPNAAVEVLVEGPDRSIVTVQTDAQGRGQATLGADAPLSDGRYTITLRSADVDTTLDLTIASSPPVIAAWSSVFEHGPAGEAALVLGSPGFSSEPRGEALGTLSVRFTAPIDPSSLTPSSVVVEGASGGFDASAVAAAVLISADLESARLTLTPPLPPGRYCLTLEGVRSAAGIESETPLTVALNIAPGDVSDDLRTNATDLAFARDLEALLAGAMIDPSNPAHVRADVDTDGFITAADLDAIRAVRGLDLRTISLPCAQTQGHRPDRPNLADRFGAPGPQSTGGLALQPNPRPDTLAEHNRDDGSLLPHPGRLEPFSAPWLDAGAGWSLASDLLAVRIDQVEAQDAGLAQPALHDLRIAHQWDDWAVVRVTSDARTAAAALLGREGVRAVAPVLFTPAADWLVPSGGVLTLTAEPVAEARTIGLLGGRVLSARHDEEPNGWALIEAARDAALRPGTLVAEPVWVMLLPTVVPLPSLEDDNATRADESSAVATVLSQAGVESAHTHEFAVAALHHGRLLGLSDSARARAVDVVRVTSGVPVTCSADVAQAIADAEAAGHRVIADPFGLSRSTPLLSHLAEADPDRVMIAAHRRGLHGSPRAVLLRAAGEEGRVRLDQGISWAVGDPVVAAAAGVTVASRYAEGLPREPWRTLADSAVFDLGAPGPDSRFGRGVFDPLRLARTLRPQTDLTGDGRTTGEDLAILLRAVGHADHETGDLNGDGRADAEDIRLLLGATTQFSP